MNTDSGFLFYYNAIHRAILDHTALIATINIISINYYYYYFIIIKNCLAAQDCQARP